MQRIVLVRGFGGAPVQLMALEASPKVVYVANPDSLDRIRDGLTEPVGVPWDDVFEFDASVFAKIIEDPDNWRMARPLPRNARQSQ
jgi:hypothetical protein